MSEWMREGGIMMRFESKNAGTMNSVTVKEKGISARKICVCLNI